MQDLRAGGRQSNAQYQYTLQSANVQDLYTWTPKLVDALEHSAVLTDVSSDLQQRGVETYLDIDRDTTARLGISPQQIDNTLYDAFGQRQVSTIYSAINQYHVVMEIDPRYTQFPDSLRAYTWRRAAVSPSGTAVTNAPGGTVTAATTIGTVATPITAPASADGGHVRQQPIVDDIEHRRRDGPQHQFGPQCRHQCTGQYRQRLLIGRCRREHVKETMIPLAAISHDRSGHTPLSVNHQGLFVTSTISFNLQPGKSLGQAAEEINATIARINMPGSINGTLAGTAQIFRQSLSKEPILILTAIAAVYILLGVLYESYVHPITILSTLPSAGVGAILALLVFNTEFDIIGLIASHAAHRHCQEERNHDDRLRH